MPQNSEGQPEERDRSLHRHEQSDENWEEAEAKTGRENDTPLRGEDKWAVENSTLAGRTKQRKEWEAKRGQKQVAEAENKTVTPARAQKKAAPKK